MWSSFLLTLLFQIFFSPLLVQRSFKWKSEKFKKKTLWFVVFWHVYAAWHHLTSYSLSCHETDSGFNTGGVTPSAVFTRFGIQLLSPLSAPPKNPLHGCHFVLVEEVKEVVLDWLAQESKHFFSRGIYALVEWSRWCAEHGGEYCSSRPISCAFFPEKCDLNPTCALCAEGKYYFQTYTRTHRVKTTMKMILVVVTIFWVSVMNKLYYGC